MARGALDGHNSRTGKGKWGEVKARVISKGHVAEYPACEAAEFESVTRAGACENDITCGGVMIDDKIFVGCVGIHADGRLLEDGVRI